MLSYIFGGGTSVKQAPDSDTESKKPKSKQQKLAEGGKKKKKGTQSNPGTKDGGDANAEHQQQQKAKKAVSKEKIGQNVDDEKEVISPMIAIIPYKFARYLDQVLVQKVEQLPAKSAKRFKALEIVNKKNQLLQIDEQLFDTEMVEQLAHELTILVESGSRLDVEKEPTDPKLGHKIVNKRSNQQSGKDNQVAKVKNNVGEGSMAQFNAAYGAAVTLLSPLNCSADEWQIAYQNQQQQQQNMLMAPTAAMPLTMQQQQQNAALFQQPPISPEQLLSCSSASLDLGQPMAMANLFDLQGTGQNKNLEMMLNSAVTPNFGEMNLGAGELARPADMSMAGIENGIERALKKSYSAYGAKACDTVGNIEEQQNMTARENIVEGNKTLRHHDDNILKQNMQIVGAKKEVALKGIDAGKEVALKNIEAKTILGEKIIGMQNNMIDKTYQLQQEQLKLKGQQLANMHTENMKKFEIGGKMIADRHKMHMKQMECAYKLNKQKMSQEHDQKMVQLTTDAHIIKVVQQGEKQRMKHEYDMLTCNDKELLAYKLKEKELDNNHALETKREEHKNALAEKKLAHGITVKTHQLNLKQLKMQQQLLSAANSSPSASRLSFHNQSRYGAAASPAAAHIGNLQERQQKVSSSNTNAVVSDEEEDDGDDESMTLESNGPEEDEIYEEEEEATNTDADEGNAYGAKNEDGDNY